MIKFYLIKDFFKNCSVIFIYKGLDFLQYDILNQKLWEVLSRFC